MKKNPRAARQRLYREELVRLLPRFQRTVVVAIGQELDLSVLADPGPRPSPPPVTPEGRSP